MIIRERSIVPLSNSLFFSFPLFLPFYFHHPRLYFVVFLAMVSAIERCRRGTARIHPLNQGRSLTRIKEGGGLYRAKSKAQLDGYRGSLLFFRPLFVSPAAKTR